MATNQQSLNALAALKRENEILLADIASLIQAAIELRKNFSPSTWYQVDSPLYRLDEVIHQTTAIGAVKLMREAEESRALRVKVDKLEAALTFAVFPGWQSYEEWVAGGGHDNPANQVEQDNQ